MKILLLLAALVYQIPLTTLDGKTEQITVEDDLQDGTRFLRCQEVGDRQTKVVTGLRCRMKGGDGAEFWVYIPAS